MRHLVDVQDPAGGFAWAEKVDGKPALTIDSRSDDPKHTGGRHRQTFVFDRDSARTLARELLKAAGRGNLDDLDDGDELAGDDLAGDEPIPGP